MILSLPDPGFFAATYLQRKFPDKRQMELLRLWDGAFNWICKHVDHAHLDPKPHPLIIAAMFLYMQYTCEKDPQLKAGHLFSAYELIAVFPKIG